MLYHVEQITAVSSRCVQFLYLKSVGFNLPFWNILDGVKLELSNVDVASVSFCQYNCPFHASASPREVFLKTFLSNNCIVSPSRHIETKPAFTFHTSRNQQPQSPPPTTDIPPQTATSATPLLFPSFPSFTFSIFFSPQLLLDFLMLLSCPLEPQALATQSVMGIVACGRHSVMAVWIGAGVRRNDHLVLLQR